MARAMLDYTKRVLEKVSFNLSLFKREIKKALKSLLPYEVDELIIWLRSYIKQHPRISPALVYLESKRSRFNR
jgi:hypothetical protein